MARLSRDIPEWCKLILRPDFFGALRTRLRNPAPSSEARYRCLQRFPISSEGAGSMWPGSSIGSSKPHSSRSERYTLAKFPATTPSQRVAAGGSSARVFADFAPLWGCVFNSKYLPHSSMKALPTNQTIEHVHLRRCNARPHNNLSVTWRSVSSRIWCSFLTCARVRMPAGCQALFLAFICADMPLIRNDDSMSPAPSTHRMKHANLHHSKNAVAFVGGTVLSRRNFT